jgi:hypothetical protein
MRARARSIIWKTLFHSRKEGADALATAWGQQKPGAVRRVNSMMRAFGRTTEMVIAAGMAEYLNEIATIDRMLDVTEARRNSALRELDRHRAALADGLRKAVEQIEEAEFKVLGPPSGGSEAA